MRFIGEINFWFGLGDGFFLTLLGLGLLESVSRSFGVVSGVEKRDKLGGGELSNLETNTGELADEVVALWVESQRGFFTDIGKVKGRFLGRFDEGVEGVGGEAELDGAKGDNDIEMFFENSIVFDQAFDELAVFDDSLLDFLGLDLLNPIIEKLDIFGDVFPLGADEKLNRKRERVNQGGIGVDSGVLLFVGEKTKVDGGRL